MALIYIPTAQDNVIDIQRVKEIRRQYDVDQNDHMAGCGIFCLNDQFDHSVWSGRCYNISVNHTQLFECLHHLPPK